MQVRAAQHSSSQDRGPDFGVCRHLKRQRPNIARKGRVAGTGQLDDCVLKSGLVRHPWGVCFEDGAITWSRSKIEVLDPEKVGTNPALQCSQERESSKAADPARAMKVRKPGRALV